MRKIILASASPRRAEILSTLNLVFDVIPSNFKEENIDAPVEEVVCYLAKNKCIEVSKRAANDDIIIAADTLVFKDKILGKPSNKEEAYRMLKSLSGCSHRVLTGICIIDNAMKKIYVDYEETKVYFKELEDKEIYDYIDTDEPMDKAGAYGIQGIGGLFVEKIDGCYFNVVGLPIHKLYKILKGMGVNLLVKDV